MDLAVTSQVTYLALSSAITVWVSRTLARHGRVFLVDAFGGNESLADAVNHLLVVGFYLINLGWIARNVRDGGTTFYGIGDAIHAVSVDIGGVLLILGVMHFMNLWIFSRIRRKALARMEPPPVLPNEFLPESTRARIAR